jgi:hypothetical protein
MLLAIVIGLRVVGRRLGLIDLFKACAISLDQGAGLVTRDAKLRLGIGQRDSIGLGIVSGVDGPRVPCLCPRSATGKVRWAIAAIA